MLPFLIYDKVEEDDIYVEYLVSLCRIVEIIMAPKILPCSLAVLSDLLHAHYNRFNILFPDAKRINKIDHIMHYVESIREFGPLSSYGCFIFEDKHQMFQQYAKVCNNFINITKSMMNVAQIYQCSVWGSNKQPLRKKLSYNKSCMSIEIVDMKKNISNLLKLQGFQDTDSVLLVNKVEVYSQKYKTDLFVVIDSGNSRGELPLFGKIKNIFIINDEVYLHYEFAIAN